MTNVLLVTVDSLRADHVGAYGYDRPTTPVLDELAEEATVYERAFAHACSTRPSFPAILTSSYPLMYGGYTTLSPSRRLVSEVFDEAGYRTGGFHSNAYLNPEFGYGRGFDHLYDSMADSSTTATLRQWVKTNLDPEGLPYRTLDGLYRLLESGAGADVGSAYVDADEMTDRAIDWITADAGPTFCWVHYMDVHHPYLPPADLQGHFRDEPVSRRRSMRLRRKMLEEPAAVTDREHREIVDLYDAEIRFVDREIGRLVEAVADHWDEYALAVTADHGEEFGDHGRYSHHDTFYDEVMHVPLLVGDGDRAGRASELVGLLDVAPTLTDLAGLESPEAFRGWSLERIREGTWPRECVIGNWEPTDEDRTERRFAYRDHEWKYIQREASTELYHLPTDPDELDDVVDANPDVVADIESILEEHKRDLAATDEQLAEAHMDREVKARLRDLGYRE